MSSNTKIKTAAELIEKLAICGEIGRLNWYDGDIDSEMAQLIAKHMSHLNLADLVVWFPEMGGYAFHDLDTALEAISEGWAGSVVAHHLGTC